MLKTERALQADVAAVYSYKRTRLQLSGYYSKVINFISAEVNSAYSVMTFGAAAVKTYSNIPFATVMGAEASALCSPFKKAEIVSTFRYTLANDNNNQPLPFVSPFKNITSIRYQPTKFSFQLETETALCQNRVSIKYAEDITPGYFLLHTRLGYYTTLFKNYTVLQLGVENLFDKNYHEHLDWKNIARPGRNIYVQLKINF